MSLEQWLSYGQLIRHEPSAQEISGLLAIVERDIVASRLPGLPADWRLNIAHNAALQAATAALAAAGYRATRDAHHYTIIQSLEHTIGLDPSIIDRMNKLHKKRNFASYTSAGAISDKEADEMHKLAMDIRRRVLEWLNADRPDLLDE